jgi:hypothetical protein
MFSAFIPGILSAILLLFFALVFKSYWRRIPFASVVMATVSDVTIKYPGTVGMVVVGSITTMLYSAFWIVSVIAIAINFSEPAQNNQRKEVTAQEYALWVFILFSMYWTSQVLANVIHVTVSGVFASFYFMSGSANGMPSSPTLGALKRAMTTSFGSICYGSLLIALIQVVEQLVKQAASDTDSPVGAFCLICLSCLIGWIRNLAEYFNRYAFVQVAIYGKPFCDAAKDTLTMFKDRGVDAIVNDSLISNVIGFGSLFSGGVSLAISWAFMGYSSKIDIAGVIALMISFMLGIIIFMMIGSVVDSGVATTFVCLAEDPAALKATKPELWEKIRQTYPQAAFINMYT